MNDLMMEEQVEISDEIKEWMREQVEVAEESNTWIEGANVHVSGAHHHGLFAGDIEYSASRTGGVLRSGDYNGNDSMIVKATPLFAFPNLTLEQVQKVEYEDGDTMLVRFEKFHKANPHVYENLRELALAARRAGKRRSGTKALFEILRYATLVTIGDMFKLNNNYTAIYARMLMKEEPELRGFFTLRERRAL